MSWLEPVANAVASARDEAGSRSGFCTDLPAGSVLRSELTCQGNVRIDGEVHGNVHCDGIFVGPQGKILGDVTTRDAIVRGHVAGNLKAETWLTLGSNAYVDGLIRASSLTIEAGAEHHSSGSIEFTDSMTVDGLVQANLAGPVIRIGPQGHVHGNITTDELDVSGRIEGDIWANNILLRSGSSIYGDVYHRELALEPGVSLEGRVRRQDLAVEMPESRNGINRTEHGATAMETLPAEPGQPFTGAEPGTPRAALSASLSGKSRDGERTLISADVQLSGGLKAPGDLHLAGKVEGDVECRMLELGRQGLILGNVTAEAVFASGIIQGDIRARSVVLQRGSTVTGDVHHETLSIEKDAVFEGASLQQEPQVRSAATGPAPETVYRDPPASPGEPLESGARPEPERAP